MKIDRIETFQKLELGFFITGLVILALEVLFIFRPMVKAIAKRTGSLEEQNSELMDLSKKLVDTARLPVRASRS